MTDTSNKNSASASYEEATDEVPNQLEPERLGCETDMDLLPKGYFYSRFFLGSIMAVGLGTWAAVASFVCLLLPGCHYHRESLPY